MQRFQAVRRLPFLHRDWALFSGGSGRLCYNSGMRIIPLVAAGLTFFALSAAGLEPAKQPVELGSLQMAFTPSHNPPALMEAADPFTRALSDLVGNRIRPLVASDYAGVVEALRSKSVDLAFVHPVGYVIASREARARIIVKDVWHGKTTYTSRIYVRKDSQIKNVEQLRGKTIAFVDPASGNLRTQGALAPRVTAVASSGLNVTLSTAAIGTDVAENDYVV